MTASDQSAMNDPVYGTLEFYRQAIKSRLNNLTGLPVTLSATLNGCPSFVIIARGKLFKRTENEWGVYWQIFNIYQIESVERVGGEDFIRLTLR